jgi:hypothetical protein
MTPDIHVEAVYPEDPVPPTSVSGLKRGPAS